MSLQYRKKCMLLHFCVERLTEDLAVVSDVTDNSLSPSLLGL